MLLLFFFLFLGSRMSKQTAHSLASSVTIFKVKTKVCQGRGTHSNASYRKCSLKEHLSQCFSDRKQWWAGLPTTKSVHFAQSIKVILNYCHEMYHTNLGLPTIL